jgi:uncharacterized membrane protein
MLTKRNLLLRLIDQDDLPPHKLDRAMQSLGIVPREHEWRRFAEKMLLWLGMLSVVTGVIFFVAYNWQGIGRIGRFALAQAVLILTLVPLIKYDRFSVIGKVALTAASILVGAILALLGQTYQTGADTWELFAIWAAIILPWVILARCTVLWIIWVALVNIALYLYTALWNPIGWIVHTVPSLSMLILFNAAVTIIWEYAYHRSPRIGRIGTRIVAVVTAIAATALAMGTIFSFAGVLHPNTLIWLVWFGSHCMFYRTIRHDLLLLSVGCLSGIMVAAFVIGRYVVLNFLGFGGFMLAAFALIVLGFAAYNWLQNTVATWKESDE